MSNSVFLIEPAQKRRTDVDVRKNAMEQLTAERKRKASPAIQGLCTAQEINHLLGKCVLIVPKICYAFSI